MRGVRFIIVHCKTVLPLALLLFFIVIDVALASSGGGGGHEPAAKGWVATDTYRILNFLVLSGVLFFIAKNPVKNFFSSRIKNIKNDLADLEQKKIDTEKNLAAYTEKIANLNKESEKIIADYVSQGEDAKKRIIAEAEAQATKLEETAKLNIEQEFKNAKMKLQQEIAEKSLKQAEKMIKKLISPKDQNRLVDDYLAKVVSS
ncbi:MAG: hypothetical protein B6I26_02965 [Desulfobacteraceae bacterium 4572_130]|nr:MAG: hypothetical protein B6I26_02965 [Desulfobacteraceae bacterium 4572_130]